MTELAFTAPLSLWPGAHPWFFLAVPEPLADDLRTAARPGEPIGPVPVEVRVGSTTWRTSLFRDSCPSTYLLPVKRAVRLAEDLVEGEPVPVAIRLLVE